MNVCSKRIIICWCFLHTRRSNFSLLKLKLKKSKKWKTIRSVPLCVVVCNWITFIFINEINYLNSLQYNVCFKYHHQAANRPSDPMYINLNSCLRSWISNNKIIEWIYTLVAYALLLILYLCVASIHNSRTYIHTRNLLRSLLRFPLWEFLSFRSLFISSFISSSNLKWLRKNKRKTKEKKVKKNALV